MPTVQARLRAGTDAAVAKDGQAGIDSRCDSFEPPAWNSSLLIMAEMSRL